MRRIAILTAGGDTPALNATMFGAVERANQLTIEVVGVIRGFAGILDELSEKGSGVFFMPHDVAEIVHISVLRHETNSRPPRDGRFPDSDSFGDDPPIRGNLRNRVTSQSTGLR